MNKTIFITGSSTGIGKATAIYFADKGWNVIATMRSPEKEQDLKERKNVHLIKLDVTEKSDILNSINAGIERFGKIDVLLNNAGYGSLGVFEAGTEEQIKNQFEVNVFGTFNTIKAVLPHFRNNKGGTIINVSSMGGKVTFPTNAVYHSTKFAIEGFSEGLFYEMASQNIKVKLIEPGFIATDFIGRSLVHFNDDSLTSYKLYLDHTNKIVSEKYDISQATLPNIVADVIYKAATDSSNRLRYIVGKDAEVVIEMKNQIGDEEYVQQTLKMFT